MISFSKIRKVFCVVYNSVPSQGSFSSKNLHTVFIKSSFFFDDFTKPLVIQGPLNFLLNFIFYFGNTSL